MPDHAADVTSLIDHLRHHPDDDGARSILADLLDELPPSPVDRGRYPSWFRLAWVRLIPPMGRYRRQLSFEVSSLLGYYGWDHAGTTSLAGLECVVSEPYVPQERIAETLRLLADTLPCCAFAYRRRGSWHPRTTRFLFLPPLEMPPPVSWSRVRGTADTYRSYPRTQTP